jgi:hypothetical protein
MRKELATLIFDDGDDLEFPNKTSDHGRLVHPGTAMIWPDKFPYDEPTDESLGGKVYLWVKKRYHKNNKPWKQSDVIVWKAWCYVIPIWIGYLVFAGVFGWLFIKIYDTYGIGKMLSFIAILALWRMNVAIKLMGEIKRKLR